MRDDEIDRMVDETGEITAHGGGVVLVTGATGLLGAQVVRRWARLARPPRLAVLVRDPERWRTTVQRLGLPSCAAIALAGDVMCDGLGLSRAARAWLGGHATAVRGDLARFVDHAIDLVVAHQASTASPVQWAP